MFIKKTIRDVDLAGQRVLLRADYNVPVKKGDITDDYRITQSVQTINAIIDGGASLVIISHLGRPDGKKVAEFSLKPVAAKLADLLGRHVNFVNDCIGDSVVEAVKNLQPGEVLLLENLRYYPEEEANDHQFAQKLIDSTGANIFVQDGFGVVHRAHASTDAIAKLDIPAVSGLLLEKEVTTITKVMEEPEKPIVAVVGGSKISDKIDILKRLIETADCVAVAGAMANNFLVAQGHKVGKSLVEEEAFKTAEEILNRARAIEKERPFNFFVPVDAVVSTDIEGKAKTRIVDLTSNTIADIEAYPKLPAEISHQVADHELVLDIGPISAAQIAGAVGMAKTVLWNGTCGVTEAKGINGAHDPFSHGTKVVVQAMIGHSRQHQNRPFVVVGGGDTVGYVESENLTSEFGHVSTGGGASLELMSGKTLPGVEVLWNKEG